MRFSELVKHLEEGGHIVSDIGVKYYMREDTLYLVSYARESVLQLPDLANAFNGYTPVPKPIEFTVKVYMHLEDMSVENCLYSEMVDFCARQGYYYNTPVEITVKEIKYD